MEHSEIRNPKSEIAWTATVGLVLAVSVARALYLLVLCPYELVFDEAQYWDWSRRLDLSYYSKGPGIAWLIASTTRTLGSSMWTVRLPSVILAAVAALMLARITTRLTAGNAKAGLYAAVLFTLIPVYQVTSLLATIDGPFICFWIIALFFAQRIAEGLTTGRSSIADWLMLGLAVGIGFLFKYTIVLLLPGLILCALILRRSIRWNSRAVVGLILAAAIFLICVSPVILWNHQRDWPTVRHLMGNINLPGGDQGSDTSTQNPLITAVISPLELVATQALLIGPAALLLVLGMTNTLALRWRSGAGWPGRLLMICCAAPILGFYLAISFFRHTQGNWPIAGFLSLIPLAGEYLAQEMPLYRVTLSRWKHSSERPRPKLGFIRRKPETLAQLGWHASIAVGLAVALISANLFLLRPLPGLDSIIPWHRLGGSRALAQQVAKVAEDIQQSTGKAPAIAANHYGTTALLAFYLPDHPPVLSAMSQLGGRKSSYDYFPDTTMTSPQLVGRTIVLVDGATQRWTRTFLFDRIDCVVPNATPRLGVYVGYNYRGAAKTQHP